MYKIIKFFIINTHARVALPESDASLRLPPPPPPPLLQAVRVFRNRALYHTRHFE